MNNNSGISESTIGKAARVREMFDRISDHYDLVNRLMTWGQDQKWRRFVGNQARIPQAGRALDIGGGTGGIAYEIKKLHSDCHVIVSDYSLKMMKAGRNRSGRGSISWCAADALDLPFPDQAFDAVVSGYLIRNAINALRAFQEQTRVLKSGGRVVCLETSPPSKSLLRPFIMIYFRWIIPFIGRLISGDKAAYTYLPDTTQKFMSPEKLSAIMRQAGLVDVEYKLFMFGTIAVHSGRRP